MEIDVPEHETIIIALDESLSMDSVRDKVINAVNSFISSHATASSNSLISMIKFGSTVRPVYINIPVVSAPPLTYEMYKPAGFTALNDAIVYAVKMHENIRNVVFVILTDGHDTSSTISTVDDVRHVIRNVRMGLNWNVIYLAANPLLQNYGVKIGIEQTDIDDIIDARSINVAVDYNNIDKYFADMLNIGVETVRKHRIDA